MIFFDTSIFVGALQRSHPRHEACLATLAETQLGSGGCAVHTLVELYSVLTRSPRVMPEDAAEMVGLVRQRMRLVSLDVDDQMDLIRGLAGRGLSGGIVHDAIIMRCARKASASVVYTLNARHFRLVEPKMAEIVSEPDATSRVGIQT